MSQQAPPPPYRDVVPPATTQTVIIQSTVPINPPVSSESTRLTCPSCLAAVRTTVIHKPSTSTHLWALILCILCWPCVCVPYCMKSCQNANHYCPNCNAFIGTYTN